MRSGSRTTRRAFSKQLAHAGLGAAVLIPSFAEAQLGSVVPTIIRWGPRVARVGGGIAGFVITEVVLGVLKAYGVDIAKAIEELVKSANSGGRIGARGEDRPRVVVVDDSRVVLNIIVNVGGTCAADGSRVSLIYDGFDFCCGASQRKVIAPGVSVWAALREDRPRGCMRDQRCGYPVSNIEMSRSGGRSYGILKQQYESGYMRLVVDDTYGTTPEAIYERNANEVVWIPQRG